MALTGDQETLDFELKVEQMRVDIELEKAQAMKSRQDWRLDPQRVIISAFLAGAAIMGAVGTIFGYLLRGSGQ